MAHKVDRVAITASRSVLYAANFQAIRDAVKPSSDCAIPSSDLSDDTIACSFHRRARCLYLLRGSAPFPFMADRGNKTESQIAKRQDEYEMRARGKWSWHIALSFLKLSHEL